MERPNTVAGLIEKRRELAARLKQAKAEIKSLTASIDAIDAVLKLFAPEVDGSTASEMRLPIPYAADRGEIRRAALNLLREARDPVTSRMVAEHFCAERGFRPNDADFKGIHYRVSIALCHMRKQGMIQRIGTKGASVRWALADS
jgi:hypothetical protein